MKRSEIIKMRDGSIRDLHVDVIALMLKRQKEQTGKEDITIFIKRKVADKYTGGFTWKESEEGWDFWSDVIARESKKTFFDKYKPPIVKRILTRNAQKGDLVEVPIPIIRRMLFNQYMEQERTDIKIFQKNRCAYKTCGGFCWESSPEGGDFWRNELLTKNKK